VGFFLAIPAAAALPTVVVTIVTWLAEFLGRRISTLAFSFSVWLAVNGAMLVSLGLLVVGTLSILDGILVAVPTIVTEVWGWFMPENTFKCLLAIMSARFLRAYHDFRIKMLDLKLRAYT